MASKVSIWLALFGVVLFMQKEGRYNAAMAHMTGNLLTNEVVDVAEEEHESKDLPLCRAGSACGYIQVNAFGLNRNQFCRCPSLSVVCPLHWDPQDGHSITMGSQQYKYCGQAPSVRACNRLQPAYTNAFLFDQASFDVMGVIHTVHCLCPQPRTHIMEGSTEDVIENMLMLGSVYKCSMLPICEADEFCKEISFTRSASLVIEKCKCPRGLVCPSLSYDVTPNEMNNNFSNGKAFSVRCQPFF